MPGRSGQVIIVFSCAYFATDTTVDYCSDYVIAFRAYALF